MFFTNFVDQCNKKGESPSAAAEAMGFKRSVVTRWKSGTEPRQATLQKISNYFGCSVADLTGEKEKPTIVSDDELSEGQKKALSLLAAMSPEEFAKKEAAIRAILDM